MIIAWTEVGMVMAVTAEGPDWITLVACSECHGCVTEDRCDDHEKWHLSVKSGEVRTPSKYVKRDDPIILDRWGLTARQIRRMQGDKKIATIRPSGKTGPAYVDIAELEEYLEDSGG